MGAFLHASQDNNATFQALQARFPARNAPEPLERIPFSSERKWSAVRFADYTFVVGAPERLAGPEEQAEKRAAFRCLGRRRCCWPALPTAPSARTAHCPGSACWPRCSSRTRSGRTRRRRWPTSSARACS